MKKRNLNETGKEKKIYLVEITVRLIKEKSVKLTKSNTKNKGQTPTDKKKKIYEHFYKIETVMTEGKEGCPYLLKKINNIIQPTSTERIEIFKIKKLRKIGFAI